MSAQKGKDLLIKIDDGAGFTTVAGLRTRRLAFNAETVDITHAGFTVTSALFRGLNAVHNGTLYFSNLRFGTCADYQLRASDLSYIQAAGSYTIVGGGSGAGHRSAVGNSIVRTSNAPVVTIAAANTYTAFAHALTGGNLICSGTSFTGAGAASITGKKYDIQSNSILQLSGVVLPGGVAGTTATGGQVV
jgi:hypothetical protein